MGEFSVKFDLPEDSVSRLPRDRAVLWVSVGGGRDFEGDRFLDIAHWAKANFKEVWIDLADTDKTINYAAFEGYDRKKAHSYAKAMGDLWLAGNNDAVDLIGEDKLIRFDHWTQNAQYKTHIETIKRLYAASEEFSDAVNKDASHYVTKKLSSFSQPHYQSSIDYILSEIAACCVRAQILKAVCLYPGKQKIPFHLIRSRVITNAPFELSLESYAAISVSRRHKKSRISIQTASQTTV